MNHIYHEDYDEMIGQWSILVKYSINRSRNLPKSWLPWLPAPTSMQCDYCQHGFNIKQKSKTCFDLDAQHILLKGRVCKLICWSIRCFMGKCRFPMVLYPARQPPTKDKKLHSRKNEKDNGPVTMINVGKHFLGTARNLLVQNEKGIMRAIHNSQTPGICANNFFKLIAHIWSGLVCNGFATSPALQISLFARAGPKIVHNAMSTLLLSNDFLLFPWLKPECDVKRLNAKWYTHLSAFLPFWSWRKSSHIFNAVGRVSMYRWKWS